MTTLLTLLIAFLVIGLVSVTWLIVTLLKLIFSESYIRFENLDYGLDEED